MSFENLARRARNRWRYIRSTHFACRRIHVAQRSPIVSFTFDDFPVSAWETGGRILRDHGMRATYYAALGLLDKESPVGRIASASHIVEAAASQNEIGCHTYSHCHAWDTPSRRFAREIKQNRIALSQVLPEKQFETMSYPLSFPRPANKRVAGSDFLGCRSGGQCANRNTLDLNSLCAYFIEQGREHPDRIEDLIRRNGGDGTWLIFATHDVEDHPTRFGCTPNLFSRIVQAVAASGARVLPVAEAIREVAGKQIDTQHT